MDKPLAERKGSYTAYRGNYVDGSVLATQPVAARAGCYEPVSGEAKPDTLVVDSGRDKYVGTGDLGKSGNCPSFRIDASALRDQAPAPEVLASAVLESVGEQRHLPPLALDRPSTTGASLVHVEAGLRTSSSSRSSSCSSTSSSRSRSRSPPLADLAIQMSRLTKGLPGVIGDCDDKALDAAVNKYLALLNPPSILFLFGPPKQK